MADRFHYFYSYCDGITGDFMPFYHDGEFHIFHIAWKDWGHISTKDFVTFKEYERAIVHGEPEDPDWDCFTGSVIEKDGVFHMFYCGHNDNNVKLGLPWEVMLHATSTDLTHWEKDKDFRLPCDLTKYAPNGWRDGFVVYDEAAKIYKMLITSATKNPIHKRWGCIALATSKDLLKWKVEEPLYAPGIYDAHECPEMFKWGDKWYLVFSTFTRWWETHYRISDSPEGPWETPKFDDLFDGRAFYAAKTVSDGNRRFIVGWTAAKAEPKDDIKYGWGGNLTAHEIIRDKDGTLRVKMIPEIDATFTKRKKVKAGDPVGEGNFEQRGRKFFIDASHSYLSVPLSKSGDACVIEGKIKMEKGTGAAGIIYRANYPKYDKWCALRIEPEKQRIYFDRSNKFFNDQFYDETRPLHPSKNGVYTVKIFCYGTICIMYVNDRVALSVRNYEYLDGQIGFFCEEGKAELSGFKVRTL